MMRWLPAILVAIPCAAQAAEAGAPPPEKSSPPGQKAAPAAKIEYDKLPLTTLLAKAGNKDRDAQFELGSRYNYGRGVPRSTAEALRWLRQAAQAGQLDAARLLAVKLFDGHDVLPDHAEALKWATLLADKGDVPAQLMLASMYANGEGTRRDLVQAYKWYAIAAVEGDRGEGEAAPKPEQLQQAKEGRDKTAGLLTDVEETLAQQQASEWWLNKHGHEKPLKAAATSSAPPPSSAKP